MAGKNKSISYLMILFGTAAFALFQPSSYASDENDVTACLSSESATLRSSQSVRSNFETLHRTLSNPSSASVVIKLGTTEVTQIQSDLTAVRNEYQAENNAANTATSTYNSYYRDLQHRFKTSAGHPINRAEWMAYAGSTFNLDYNACQQRISAIQTSISQAQAKLTSAQNAVTAATAAAAAASSPH